MVDVPLMRALLRLALCFFQSQRFLARRRNMTTARIFTTADADRLLGLGDQFLQDWSETARGHGEPTKECEERAAEWESIRPLLALAPQLLALLDEAETLWGEKFACDDPIDRGDLVEWIAEWLPKVRSAIAGFRGQCALTASEGQP
jgi:hypothetical protein